ncbi:MAG: phytoene desaturase family protein, partial [Chloroflexota bacterium]
TEELWPGFHFSTCAHMVHAVHPRIIRDLRLQGRGLEVLPRASAILLNPDGTYYGPAGHESPRNLAFAERLTAEEREGQRRYGDFKRALNALLAPYRLGPPPALADVRRNAAGTPAAEVLEQALTTRLSRLHQEFLPTERLRERFAAEKASVERDPLALSLAYSSIDEPDEATGEKPPHGYVRGGTGAVSRLMAQAAEEAGAQLHVGAEVEQFLVEHGRVIGVRLAHGADVRSRVVVSNLDPKRTFLRLTPRHVLDRAFVQRVEGLATEVSCVKLLAAISEAPQWKDWDGDPARPGQGVVGLHRTRTLVAQMWDDVEAGRPPRAPVISFSLPSAVDASLAPPGHHTASCWIVSHPARLSGGRSWDDVREAVAERIIDQITEYAPNFRHSILNYKLRTPLDLENENGLTDGSIWHVQHTGEQLFWNRPLPELAHYRAPLAGLYLCGAGQHPGGEVSGIPGHNAAHEVLKDLTL